MAGQGILNISYAIVYIPGRSLSEHLDRAVGEVTYISGQTMAPGHPVGCVAKAHTLNPAGEDYVLCNHGQLTIVPAFAGMTILFAIDYWFKRDDGHMVYPSG